jgi:polyhydroxyalkanoate synthesis regulator phasin
MIAEPSAITPALVVSILTAIGAGGLLNEAARRFFDRNKLDAETKEIESRTKKSISEIVEAQTKSLLEDFSLQRTEMEELRTRVTELEHLLNESVQYNRIKVLEADVAFWQNRTFELQKRIEEVLNAGSKRSNGGTPLPPDG